NAIEVFNGLKKLEEHGLLQFNESFHSPSMVHMLEDHTKLYEFQVAHAQFVPLIKMMLRLYGGEIFSSFVRIDEASLARAMTTSAEDVLSMLFLHHSLHILFY